MFSLFLKSLLKDLFPFFLLMLIFLSILAWFIFFISGIISFLSSPLTLLEYFFMEIKEFPYFFENILPFTWVFSLTYTLFRFKRNNSLIIIEQAGVSLGVIKKSLFLIAFFLIIFLLLFSEFYTFPLKRVREQERERFLGVTPSQKEYIFLINEEKDQICIAQEFNFKEEKLRKTLIIYLNNQKEIIKIIKSDFLEIIDNNWIGKNSFSWEKKEGFWEGKTYREDLYVTISIEPFDLFLKGKEWENFSIFELFSFLKLNLEYQKALSYPLLYQILLRIFSYFFYFLAIIWSFNVTSWLEKPSFLIAIVLSLSFNFLYTIINLVLFNLTSLDLLSLNGFLLFQLLFILAIFFSSKSSFLFRLKL